MKKLSFCIASATALCLTVSALAADAPGVTATEIKVGGVFPFSGPLSSTGLIGRSIGAYVRSVNDRGGINGRTINFISYDDSYSPPKAVEHVRKLVESDEVAFIFSQVGTPTNSATAKYLTAKQVPGIGIVSGSGRFTNVVEFPWTTTSLVSFDTEAKIYAKYLRSAIPDGKYGILFQNDDLGKDYVNAFKVIFKDDFAKRVVAISYDVSDPTVDSQIVNLRSAQVDSVLVAGTPKFAAQTIKKISELGWKPLIILNYPSATVGASLRPAGLDKSVGIVVGSFTKDPVDPKWDSDRGIKDFRAFIEKYLPGSDISDSNYLFGYTQALIMEQIIKQCGNDLSRENIMRQAKNLKNVVLPTMLPGIAINTSSSNNMHYTQMRLQRWTGSGWEQFGGVLDAASE